MGLASLLTEQAVFEDCVETANPDAAWHAFQADQFDLVICDVSFERQSGLDLVKKIRSLPSPCPILVISMHEEDFWAERALRAGANGYLMKQCERSGVLEAIKTVMAGDIYLSPRAQQQILRDLSGQTEKRIPLNLLTEREKEVFQYLVQGLNSESIAKSLFISLKTVQTHQANIRRKLDVSSLTELRKLAHGFSA